MAVRALAEPSGLSRDEAPFAQVDGGIHGVMLYYLTGGLRQGLGA